MGFFRLMLCLYRLVYHIYRRTDLICSFLQETCSDNAKSRQSPNTHKPLSGVHEEDINPDARVLHFNLQAIRCALASSTWLLTSCFQRMVLFSCMTRVRGEGLRRGSQNSQRLNFTIKNSETKWPFAPRRNTQSQHVSKEWHPVYHCTEYMPPKLANWCSF